MSTIWSEEAVMVKRSIPGNRITSSSLFFSRFLPTQFTVKVGEWDLTDYEDYSREINVEEIRLKTL